MKCGLQKIIFFPMMTSIDNRPSQCITQGLHTNGCHHTLHYFRDNCLHVLKCLNKLAG